MSSRQTNDLAAAANVLRREQKFLLSTHENPDGDALGSLLAMKLALDRLGKDGYMYHYGETPLPREYVFMPLDDLHRELPPDAGERVLVAVDCASELRLGTEHDEVLERVRLVVNIDHHHDNTRFGDVNVIVATASSTGEIVRDLLRELDVDLTPQIAEALYIAVVTDTGRFQYTNTTPRALRLAAERAEMAALIRAPPRRPGAPARKVSLRASADEIDVSAIARKWGGGHRQAAGFSSDRTVDEITRSLQEQFAAFANASRDGA